MTTGGICTECGHKPSKPIAKTWLNKLLRTEPQEGCTAEDHGQNAGGWPGTCECTAPFHAAHALT